MTDKEKQAIAKQIAEEVLYLKKDILTTSEAARFLGISCSRLYKMTMARKIPFYKSPQGRLNYFNRVELENWAQSNRRATIGELNDRAQALARR